MNLIEGKTAQIEWATDGVDRVTELVVFDRDAISAADHERYMRRLDNSNGACIAGWMEGERARQTPEGLFFGLMNTGFADDVDLLNALDQFGQIREAGWARTMAEAFREELRSRCGDDVDAAAEIPSAVYE